MTMSNNMLQLNMTAVPTETLYNLSYTVIKISGAIVATVIVAQLINRALAAYFKFATGKLKVDETTYSVVRRVITGTIYLIGIAVVITLIPGLPDLVLGMAVSAGIAAIIIAFAAQRALSNVFSGICRVGLIVHLLLEYWLRGYYEPPHRTGLEVFPHPALQEYILYVCLDRA